MDLSNVKLDIIIQGGQSNSEGYGVGSVESAYIPSKDVLYLIAEKQVEERLGKNCFNYADKPFSIEIAQERKSEEKILGDLSLTFSEEYRKAGLLQNDRKLLIVRAAVGGTGFKKAHWGLHDVLYLKMLEMTDYALSLNRENRVVAFLWHQGEHDAFEGNEPSVYYRQLTDLLNGVRSRYGKKLPFIAGDFVNDWKSRNMEICQPIIEKIRQVVKESNSAAFVETENLLSNDQKLQNGDYIHFCRQSLYELGRRYFSAFEKLKKNEKSTPKIDVL